MTLPWLDTPHKTKAPRELWKSVLAGSGVTLLCVWLGLQLFLPDPTGNAWRTAQRLENINVSEALRLYELIVRSDPASAYAPQALQREGDLLAAQARRTRDVAGLRSAVSAYERLATTYTESPLAGPALQTAGGIAMDELHDNRTAAQLYFDLLKNYPNNAGFVAEATTRLGRIAIMNGQKDRAKELFQRVLQRYPQQLEPCAEAQYHLGVLYESLFKNKDWATNAYDATIRRYPQSSWADAARERLGLITYRGIGPRVRRVLIRIPPLPQLEGSSGSLLSAIRPLLAARGANFSDTLLLGMTLHPFVVGYNPRNPSQVVRASGDPAFTLAANVGLSAQTQKGGSAIAALQEELDRGRPSAVYVGGWRLCVGYDSQLNQIFLAQPNGGLEELGVKEFDTQWAKSKALGTTRASVTLFAPDDKPQAATTPTPLPGTSASVPQPTPTTPRTELLQTPTWQFAPPPLKPRDALRRTLRNAAAQMRRTQREDGALLNKAALQALISELDGLTRVPSVTSEAAPSAEPTPTFAPDAPLPVPEETATAAAEAAATPLPEITPPAFGEEDVTPGGTPSGTATVAPVVPSAQRWKALSAWFSAPLDEWITQRRTAAAFLDEAANTLNAPALKNAASALREEIAHLEVARTLAPPAEAENTAANRSAWRTMSQELRQARAADLRAAQIMTQATG